MTIPVFNLIAYLKNLEIEILKTKYNFSIPALRSRCDTIAEIQLEIGNDFTIKFFSYFVQ